MKPDQAVQQIRAGEPEAVYLIHGESEYLRQQVIDALMQAAGSAGAVRDMNVTHIDGGDQALGPALEQAQTPPMLADRRLVVISEPLPLLSSGGSDEERERQEGVLLRYTDDPPPYSVLALVAEKTDGRRRATRQVKERASVVDCDPPKPWKVGDWLREHARSRGIQVTKGAAERIAGACGAELRLAVTELEKAVTYAPEGSRVTAQHVRAVLAESTQERIFDLVDAIGQKETAEALRLLRQMLRQQQAAQRLLFMIARQIRLIWHALVLRQRGASQGDIRQALDQHPYVIKKVSKQSRNFTEDEIERALPALSRTDYRLKAGGWDEQQALEMLVVELSGGTQGRWERASARRG